MNSLNFQPKSSHVSNPLTIIAIFAGLAEVMSTVALPLIDAQNQGVFIWFLMGFPLVLLGLFFITLNFNHKVLYAPKDYRDDESFLSSVNKISLDEMDSKIANAVQETIYSEQFKDFVQLLPPF